MHKPSSMPHTCEGPMAAGAGEQASGAHSIIVFILVWQGGRQGRILGDQPTTQHKHCCLNQRARARQHTPSCTPRVFIRHTLGMERGVRVTGAPRCTHSTSNHALRCR